jgi:hypothetical protein
MKKIVSLVVFVAALVWTWNVIHTNEAIGFETHAGIQTKLAELIKATLAAKKPNAKDLRIEKLWTESMTDNKVRAVFSYKFSEVAEGGDNLEQIIEGEAILHREPTEDKTDKWTLQSVKTTNDIVVFSEGSTVTPDTETSEAPAATPAASPAAPEHH